MAANQGPLEGNAFQRVWSSFDNRRKTWGIVFFLAITVLLSIDFLPNRVNVKVGDVNQTQIKAPQGTVFISDVRTEKARQEEADRVEPVFTVDQEILDENDVEVDNVFKEIAAIKADDALNDGEKTLKIQSMFTASIPLSTVNAVIEAEADTLNQVSVNTKTLISEYMGKGVQETALENARQEMTTEVDNLGVENDFKPLVKAIIGETALEPTLVIDEESMEEKRQEAMDLVQPVQVTVRQGEEIIGDGQVVTEENYEILEQLGLLKTSYRHLTLLGLVAFILLVFVLIVVYLYRYNREILQDEKKFVLLGLLITVGLLIDKGIMAIRFGSSAEIASMVGFMVPTAAVSMLIAVLLNRKLAVFITAIMSVFVGLMMGSQLGFAVVSFVGGVVGIFCVSEISQRNDLTRASIYIILANVVSISAVLLVQTNSFRLVGYGLIVGVINGLLSAILTIGALPFLENAFGITTSLKLLELSNPNQPLLHRLLVEAPGTYHHSMMVANLAEAAADATGADQLLARVGAYYHDIGKLKRPYFFIENNLTAENPHDKLTPTLSTLVITSHVKEGGEMAEEYELPPAVKDIICQHHGTSLVSYFYHKACEAENQESLNETAFRYEAKKPQTKEAAIVMLADAVEAAVRSMKYSGPGRLEGQVRKIINDKLEDGQLEESELTYKELGLITKTFVKILSGIFHSRIEYPDQLLQEFEGRKKSGNNVKQLPGDIQTAARG